MLHVFAVSTADCNRFVCRSPKCCMYLQSLQQTVTGLFAGVKNVTCICSLYSRL